MSNTQTDNEKIEGAHDAVISDHVPEGLHVKNLEHAHRPDYDEAAGFLADMATRPDAATLMAPWSAREEKQMRRKVDLIVLPLVTMSLMMGGVDKVILGTTATFGLRTDLGLVGQQYSWCSSIIFFGAMLTVFPQGWLCQRFPTGKIFAVNVFCFGIMTFATLGAKNYGSLAAIRFILGMFEGLNTSGAGLVISMWWRKEERGWRTVLIFNTFSSIVNGFLCFVVQFYSPSHLLSRWQLVYLVTACISVTFGIIDWFCLPANPTAAWWLTDRQKYIGVERMADQNTGIVNLKFKWSQAIEAFKDPKTYLYFLISVTLNIPNGGLTGFYGLVIAGFGFTIKQNALMQMPTGVISWGSALIWVTIAQYTKKPLFCAMGSVLVLLASTIALKLVPHTNVGGSLACLYLLYSYWAPYMVFGQLIMYANVGGTSKKVVVFGVSYIGYTVGNLVGPQSFRADQAPAYPTAYTVMLVGYCITLALLSLYGYICWRDNKRKVIQEQEYIQSLQGRDEDVAAEWQDLTDIQNPKFRYTW